MAWRIGESTTQKFLNTCKRIVEDPVLWKWFKRNPAYQIIIGDDNPAHALTILPTIKDTKPVWDNRKKFLLNDSIGMDILCPAKIEGQDVSANTIRNIHSVCLLHKSFGDLNGKTVLEIGPGWGGLAFCVKTQWPNVDYAIIDYQEQAELCIKYLHELGIDDVVSNPPDISPDIVIAEYSVSEQDDESIGEYWEKYMKDAKGLFLRWNTFSEARDKKWFDVFRTKFKVSVSIEHKNRATNKIVICQ